MLQYATPAKETPASGRGRLRFKMSVCEQPEMEDWISRRWEKQVGSFIRFYEVHLRPDLWGNWTIVQVWGRRNSALGRVITLPVDDYAAGLQLLQQIGVRRRQRGYEIMPSA